MFILYCLHKSGQSACLLSSDKMNEKMVQDENKNRCEICDNIFENKTHFSKHIKNVHEHKENKYKCNICTKCFNGQCSGHYKLTSKPFIKVAKITNVALVENNLLRQVPLRNTSKPFMRATQILNVILVENHLLKMVI